MKTFVIFLLFCISLHTMATSSEGLLFDASAEHSHQITQADALPFRFDKINISIKKKFDMNDYSPVYWRDDKRIINTISASDFHVNTLGNMELFLINDDIFIETNHVEYDLGVFSMETGFTVANMDNIQGKRMYSKGSLNIFSDHNFDLTVFAQIELFDETLTQGYYQPLSPESFETGSSSVSTLGLTGSYKLNRKWQVIGAVSTTHLSEEITNSPLIEEANRNIAVIGTTYSF